MSHYDPQFPLPLPDEYVAHCQSMRHDMRIGNAVIYTWCKDPSVIGKAGSENFWKSLLIGRLDGGQTILLTCETDGYGQNPHWEYRIAGYAEWTVHEKFDNLAALLAFLRHYKGIVL